MQDGTVALGLARETTGRPRKLVGPDTKQFLRFPLHTTPDDILELYGAGVYRVYALDAFGEQLSSDHLSRLDLTSSSIRDLRNSSMESVLGPRGDRITTSAGSDLRFALEAMASMMRTNTEALRLVAESQVDLAKTIATVKGLPRNAAMYLPAAAHANDDEDEDEADDEDNEEIEDARPSSYIDLLLPFSQALAPIVADMVPGLVGKVATQSTPKTATDESTSTSDLADRPFEVRELVDLQYARKKGEAKRAATPRATVSPSLTTRVMSDAKLAQQILAIKKELSPAEIQTLMSSASTWSEAAQTKFLETIKPLSTEMAVAYCQEVIETIRANQASPNVVTE